MYIKTDANGLVIGVTEEIGETPLPNLEFDEIEEGSLFTPDGIPMFAVRNDTFVKRSDQELQEAEEAQNGSEELPFEDEGEYVPSLEDRIAMLEQELELLLSGEVE